MDDMTREQSLECMFCEGRTSATIKRLTEGQKSHGLTDVHMEMDSNINNSRLNVFEYSIAP